MWRIFGGRRREAELDEELQAHIEIEARRLEDEGLSAQEAAREARRTLGNRALIAEQTRDSWGARWLAGVRQDLDYGWRSCRRAPLFSVVVVLSLALGIAAATVIFSVADTVFLRPLPYRTPGELMFVAMRLFGREMVLSPDYVAWRTNPTVFQDLAAMQLQGGRAATLGNQDPLEVRTTRVSYNFLPALGVRMAMGRSFEQREELPNAPRTAILSDVLWRNHFHSRPDIVGQKIVLDGAIHEIIGVLPPSFLMPMEVPTDILMPLPISPTLNHHDREMAAWTVIGRLRPGVTQDQALAGIETLFGASKMDAPELFRNDVSVMVEPLRQRISGNARTLLLVLAGAVIRP